MTGMTGAAIGAVVAAVAWPLVARTIGARPWWVPVATVLISGALGALVSARAVAWPAQIGFVVFGALVPCLVITDVAVWRLPFGLTLPAGGVALAGFAASAVVAPSTAADLVRALAAGAVVAGAAIAVALLAPGQLGGGDIVLVVVIALVLGWLGWTSLITGILSGFGVAAVAGLITAVREGSFKSRFPLGPFLTAGWVIAVMAGT